MARYKINEIFYSIQGEGFHAGTPAVFIRFSGCNLKCPFCDTKHNEGKYMDLQEILKAVKGTIQEAAVTPSLVVLTGGEPSLYADEALCLALRNIFLIVAMESNGTHQTPVGVNFLTVSPKDDFVKGAAISVDTCDELKLVFTGENDPGKWTGIRARHLFLQPCDTGNPVENIKIVQKAVEYAKKHPVWRISLQTQKILNVR